MIRPDAVGELEYRCWDKLRQCLWQACMPVTNHVALQTISKISCTRPASDTRCVDADARAATLHRHIPRRRPSWLTRGQGQQCALCCNIRRPASCLTLPGCCRNAHSQAKLADSEAKATKFTERLAHERSKRGTFDKELKAVEAEHSAAEKALEAASRKAEAAATAMKELEQRDVKVRVHGRL